MSRLPRIPLRRLRLGGREISSLSRSSVRGASETPLIHKTFPEFYASLLSHYGDRLALVSAHESPAPHAGPNASASSSKYLSWTFEHLDWHVKALARGMVQLGIQKGDRVGVVMGNNSAYATLQWACAEIGAILVTINPAYRMREMVASMNLVGVSTLFIVPSLRSSDYISQLKEVLPSLSSPNSHIEDSALPSLRNIVLVDNISNISHDLRHFPTELSKIPAAIDFRDILDWSQSSISSQHPALHPDDVINLQYTSGTTGAPKAVSLTHHNLLNNAHFIGACMALTPADKILNVPPLFHCFGLVLGNLAAWVHGSSIVYASESYDPRAILRVLEEEKCTGVHGVPTHFLGVLKEFDRAVEKGRKLDLSRLRTGIAAGSTIPIDLMHQLIQKLNLKDLTIVYGMTETSPASFQTVPSDPIDKRCETVGRVQPHVSAKVVNTKGDVVPIGEPGELLVSGYLLQKGYWNDPEQTEAVMKKYPNEDGVGETEWMHTGDQAIMDEEGYLRIVGRIKDIIIRGGENLFPVQIENVLTSHPQIREAAAIAVPDERFGEVVGVWIVCEEASTTATSSDKATKPEPRLSEREVKEWVSNKMNPQNTPTYVWFVGEGEAAGRYDELPKTASGKVQKNVLREWAKTLLEERKGSQ